MPRRGRIHQQAVCYHLYNRGINRDELFHDERDYGRFVQFAARYKERCGARVYHWCLMPNHYHLLVRLPFAMLRAFAGGLQQAYALYHHRRHGTCGVLWQGRYHSKPVADDLSLARCGRYIERNPVRAKLVERAWDWPAGSGAFYVLGKADGLTDVDVRYDDAGLSAGEREAYAAMLCDEEDDRWMETQTGLAIGPPTFVQRFTESGGHLRPRRGPSRRCARNTTEVIQ